MAEYWKKETSTGRHQGEGLLQDPKETLSTPVLKYISTFWYLSKGAAF